MAVSQAKPGWLAEYHVGLLRKLGRGRILSEHRLIVELIKDLDDGSAAAMLAHLNRVNDLYLPSAAPDP